MKKMSILSVFLVFVACATKVKDSQLYGKCKIPMYGCIQLKLNENQTFEYYVFADVGGENLTKGTWKIHNGDTLVLNSSLKLSKEEIENEKMFPTFSNPKYIVNQLIVLKANKIIYIPKNKDVKIYSLKKTKLSQQKWK